VPDAASAEDDDDDVMVRLVVRLVLMMLLLLLVEVTIEADLNANALLNVPPPIDEAALIAKNTEKLLIRYEINE